METLSLIINILLSALIIVFLFKDKNKKRRKKGKTAVIMTDSTINAKILESENISAEELMSRARRAGFFNLGDIDTAVLEPDGEISFLAAPMKRALNPADFNFAPVREGFSRIIIQNGSVLKENLAFSGISEEALFNLLNQRGSRIQDIFLATANEAGRVDFFGK